MTEPSLTHGDTPFRARSDVPFFACFLTLALAYVVLIVGMLVADVAFTSLGAFWAELLKDGASGVIGNLPHAVWAAFGDLRAVVYKPEIRFATGLSLASCTASALLSLVVAIPIGYLMSRFAFFGKNFVDAVLDIPIVLPPLVIGLSLLILFQTSPGRWLEDAFMWSVDLLRINTVIGWFGLKPMRGVTYDLPSVVLAQFAVACAFAVRTMRVTFDQIDTRREQVALTLGCSRGQAFFRVVLPEAGPGVLTAGTLAWARSMGEFGPILVFAGATRMKTEVLPTTVFLELSVGDINAAVAVSMLMVTAAVLVLVIARTFGVKRGIL